MFWVAVDLGGFRVLEFWLVCRFLVSAGLGFVLRWVCGGYLGLWLVIVVVLSWVCLSR